DAATPLDAPSTIDDEAPRLTWRLPRPIPDALPFKRDVGNELPLSAPSGLPVRSPGAPLPSRPPRLTLEQYASLCAEIAASPAETSAVRARYGLDDAAHFAERDEWHRRFVADTDLYARYAHLFQVFRDYLTAR